MAANRSGSVPFPTLISNSSDKSGHGHSHGDGNDHKHGHGNDVAIDLGQGIVSRGNNRLIDKARYRVQRLWHLVWDEPDARRIFIFIACKLIFMSFQFMFGVWKASLPCLSASFHTGFDCLALSVTLIPMVLAKRKGIIPGFSYGFDRFEVLAAFTNSLFLIFIGIFVMMETFHMLHLPPDIHTDDLSMACFGLVIDCIGISLFYKNASIKQLPTIVAPMHQSNHLRIGHQACRGDNLHSVYLHALADLLGHTGLLAVAWIIANIHPWKIAYPIMIIIVSSTIIVLAYPLSKRTGMILLQTTAPSLQSGLQRCLREISFRDGVLECRNAHWWSPSPGNTVGSLHIRVRADVDEQDVLLYANNLLLKYVNSVTIQIEKDQSVNWLLQQQGGHE